MKSRHFKQHQAETFLLCWVAYAIIYFGRINLSAALPRIGEVYNWSKIQTGMLGTLFFWIYGTGQLINGYMGDKVPGKFLIFLGLMASGLSNICFGLVKGNLAVMMVIWAMNGFFQSMLWGPIVKILSHWFSYEQRSRIGLGISTSMAAGYLMAWGLSGWILTYNDWQWVFWIPGSAIVIYAFLWHLLIKEHPKDTGMEFSGPLLDRGNNSNNNSNEGRKEQRYTLWQVFKSTRLWYIVIACFAHGIIKDGIGLWGPTFLIETYGLSIGFASGAILLVPVFSLLGIILAGWLNKKFGCREKFTIMVLLAGGAVVIAGLAQFGSAGVFYGVVFLGAVSAMMYGANTLLLGVIPLGFAKYQKTSSVAGFLDFCSYLAAGIAASVTGFLVDKIGWNGVLGIWTVVSITGFISLLLSLRAEKGIATYSNRA